jgi:hypothetical protein
MALDATKITFRAPVSREQGSSNIGRMSTISIVSNTMGNVFPNVFSADRENGARNYQGLYCLVQGEATDTLVDAYQYLFKQPSGDEYVCFFVGDQRSTAGDYGLPDPGAADNETQRKYGPAVLAADVAAGGTTITITCKNAALAAGANNCWQAGDNFFVTDRVTASSTEGNFEKRVISGSPAVNPDGVTVTISFAEPLTNGYTAGAVVSTFPPKSSIICNQFDNLDTTGITGTTTVDLATAGNMVVNSVGALEMTLTFEMTAATTFDVTTDYSGRASLPSGNTTVDYAPSNGDVSQPYFTLKAGAISTGQTGDIFTLQIHPPAVCIVQKKVTPAGSGPVTGANCSLVNEGEA